MPRATTLPRTVRTRRARRAAVPRWRRRKDARPEELVNAALEVFVERGYAATRLAEVASRAGVTKGTIYLYFDGKEELFKAVVRQSLVPLLAAGERLVAAHEGTQADLVRALLHQWWAQVGETAAAGLQKLMVAEAQNFPELARFYHDEVVRRGRRLFERVIEAGIASGEFRRVDPTTAARLLAAPVLHMVLMKHSFLRCARDPGFDPRTTLAMHLDFFLRAIAPPEATTHA